MQQLRQCGLRLREPERHFHSTIQFDGGGEFWAGLLPLAGCGIQRTETTLAVGLEWAHAEFLGQSQGLSVVGFSLCGVRGLALCCDLAKQPEGPCLIAAFPALTGEAQETLCQAVRLLHTTGQEVTLSQVEHDTVPAAAGSLPYFDLVEQVQRLGDLSGPRIGQPQSGHNRRQIERDIRGAALSEGMFEYVGRVLEIPLTEGKQA